MEASRNSSWVDSALRLGVSYKIEEGKRLFIRLSLGFVSGAVDNGFGTEFLEFGKISRSEYLKVRNT